MLTRFLAITCVGVFLLLAATTEGGPADNKYTTKKFQNAIEQQNFHTILMSIEERLRNLDTVYSQQYSPTVEGKLDHYIRKLDSIETKIARLEAVMSLEMDRIVSNISNKNFKDEIAQEHLLRKINDVYDRINHRVIFIELKMDMNQKKLEDKLDVVIAKVQKLDDTIVTGFVDTEEEIGEILSEIDDLKTIQSSSEDATKNLSKELKIVATKQEQSIENRLNVVRETFVEINGTCFGSVNRLEKNLTSQLQFTARRIVEMKDNYDENLNEYSLKIADMYSDNLEKNEHLEASVKTIAGQLNATRVEQQNSFRSLMIQVGRKTGKQNVLSDPSTYEEKLTEISKKLDKNFENVMTAQNMFLESCHRVQMDENQLESKISVVLEKMIDTFEKKTSFDPKNFKNLEQILKNYDAATKRSLYQIVVKLNRLGDILGNQTECDYNELLKRFDRFENSNFVGYLKHINQTLTHFERKLNITETSNKTSETQLGDINQVILKTSDTNKFNVTKDLEDLIAEVFGKGFIVPKSSATKSASGDDGIGNVIGIDIRSNFNEETENSESTTQNLDCVSSNDHEETTESYKDV